MPSGLGQLGLFDDKGACFVQLEKRVPKAVAYFSAKYNVPVVQPDEINGRVALFSLHTWRDFYAVARLSHLKTSEWIAGGNAAANPTGVRWLFDWIHVGDAYSAMPRILAGERELPGMLLCRDDAARVEYVDEPPPRDPLSRNEYVMSKGCRRRCAFCVNPWRQTYREAERDDVLGFVERFPGKGMYLISNSACDVSFYRDVEERLLALGKSNMTLPTMLAATSIRSLHNARQFGVEGASERLRRLVNKPIRRDVYRERMVEYLDRGCNLTTTFQFNLPTETADDWREFDEDLAWITERATGGAWTLSFIPHQPTPLTPSQWIVPRYDLATMERLLELRAQTIDAGGRRGQVALFVAQPLGPRSWFRQILGEWLPVTRELDRATAGLPARAPIDLYVDALLRSEVVDARHVFKDKPREYAFPWDCVTVRAGRDELWSHFARLTRRANKAHKGTERRGVAGRIEANSERAGGRGDVDAAPSGAVVVLPDAAVGAASGVDARADEPRGTRTAGGVRTRRRRD